jgi:outer membrane biosynthesis protein TonB
MSNLAEKLPRLVKEKLENVETRRQEIVGRLDSWVDSNLPKSVVGPIRNTDTVTVEAIKDAATAAGDEFVSFLRMRWTDLRGGSSEPVTGSKDAVQPTDNENVSQEPAEKPVAKKPAAKKPAAKKPVAKKPVAKKPVAKKPVAKKPAAKKPAAKKLEAKASTEKAAAKKTVSNRNASRTGTAVKKSPAARPSVDK